MQSKRGGALKGRDSSKAQGGTTASQSLSRLYVHLVFSTRNREPLLKPDVHLALQAYLAGIFDNIGSHAEKIGGWDDHVHSLFSLSKNLALCDAVKEVKASSSSWLKTQGCGFRNFHWQNGYGGFSVSQSEVPRVLKYIEDQQAHHRRVTFQEELRQFLKKYQIPYDERYVWD
jgi:REP element-mobilizing transposase RayT